MTWEKAGVADVDSGETKPTPDQTILYRIWRMLTCKSGKFVAEHCVKWAIHGNLQGCDIPQHLENCRSEHDV